MVNAVKRSGLVDMWNRSCFSRSVPEEMIKPLDRIMSINDETPSRGKDVVDRLSDAWLWQKAPKMILNIISTFYKSKPIFWGWKHLTSIFLFTWDFLPHGEKSLQLPLGSASTLRSANASGCPWPSDSGGSAPSPAACGGGEGRSRAGHQLRCLGAPRVSAFVRFLFWGLCFFFFFDFILGHVCLVLSPQAKQLVSGETSGFCK